MLYNGSLNKRKRQRQLSSSSTSSDTNNNEKGQNPSIRLKNCLKSKYDKKNLIYRIFKHTGVILSKTLTSEFL